MVRSVAFALLVLVCAPGCQLVLGIHELGTEEGAAGAGDGGGPPVPSDEGERWWDESYGYRQRLTLEMNVPEPDFPALVKLGTGDIDYALLQPGGEDLRFLDSDNATLLPHEIEAWNDGGESVIWVRMPERMAGESIYMYYGKRDAPGRTSAHDVWQDTHIAVYHLADALPESGDSAFANSASASFAGTGRNGVDADNRVDDGAIGPAIGFIGPQGTDEQIFIGDFPDFNVEIGQQKTIELWFRAADMGRDQHLFFKEGACRGWDIYLRSDNYIIGRYTTVDCNRNNYELVSRQTYTDGGWHYLAFVIDRPGGFAELYIDGQSQGRLDIDNTEEGSAYSEAVLGTDYDGGQAFVGAMDEVRVSSTARSAVWIEAHHRMATSSDVWQIAEREMP